MTWGGIPVLLSPLLTDSKKRMVRRTWFERLCSWPWRPWQPQRQVTMQVPSKQVFNMGDRLVMHPATWEELKRQLPFGNQH